MSFKGIRSILVAPSIFLTSWFAIWSLLLTCIPAVTSSLFDIHKGAFTSAMPLNLQNHEQKKSHLQSFRLPYSLPTHSVPPLPYGPSTLVCPFITVIKYLSKATGAGEGLPPLTSLMEVRLYPLLWDVPGSNLRARTEAEAMKEYCLLVYSLWLARPDFWYHQDHLSV